MPTEPGEWLFHGLGSAAKIAMVVKTNDAKWLMLGYSSSAGKPAPYGRNTMVGQNSATAVPHIYHRSVKFIPCRTAVPFWEQIGRSAVPFWEQIGRCAVPFWGQVN